MNKLLLTLVTAVALFTGASAQTLTRAYAIRMWASNVEGNEPALVSFDLNNPQEIREEFSLAGHYFRSAVCIDRNYYLIDSDDQMVPYRLLKLNIDTHQLETIAEYDSRSFEGGLIFQDMTYDAATGTVYALAFDIDSGTMTDDQELDIPLGLFSLDVTTGTATRIKIYSNDTNMLTLSASSDGYLYAISGLGELWDIQKSSGRLGDILCETGIYPATVQSAEFCPTDGKLYWTGFYATADAVGNPVPNGFLGCFTFGDDMVTFERLAEMPHNEELIGLYIDPNPIDRNAPARVTGLVATADASGDRSATLTWLNPSLNVGGDKLAEDITIDIYRNDALITTLNGVTPGSEGSYTDNVGDNCNVTYHLIARNNAGSDRPVYAPTVFVGHDLPAEVQNLTAQRTGTGYDIAVSWNVPVAGINGGWIDASAFTYDVVRYPDEKVIASATTATSLTDNTITEPAGYYYAVTASNADGKGATALSNTVVSGSALDVPYSCDFSTPEMARQWTVVDANHDGQSFYRETTAANGEWFMKFFPDRELGPEVPADDWLISSLIHMEAGATYAIHYQVRTLGALFPLNFDVTLGTAISAEAQSRVLNSYTDFGYESTWYYNTETLTIDETGNYTLAFHVKNAVSASFSFIYVEKLNATDLQAVELLGNTTPSLNTPVDYKVTVKNCGYTAATGYTVKLIDENDNVLASVEPSEAIEPQATAEVAISWTPTAEGKYSIRAVVEIAGDAVSDNNTSAPLSVDVVSGGRWIDLTFYDREIGYTPVDLRSNYSMTQTIYDMDVLGARQGGTISAITYPYRVAYAVDPIDVVIYLANVEKPSFADKQVVPMEAFTKVYEGQFVLPVNDSQVSVTFSTPFNYTGGYLCVMVEYVGGKSRKGIFFKASQDNNWDACLATYGGTSRFDFTQKPNYYQDRASLALLIQEQSGVEKTVVLNGALQGPGAVFDLTGRRIADFTDFNEDMPQLNRGIYIVKTATATRKIAVK